MFGRIKDTIQGKMIQARTNDELLYEYVLEEIENDIMSKGLWGKALANSGGNTEKAKSMYLQYRVQAIKDAFASMQIAYNNLSKPALYRYIEEKLFETTPITTSTTTPVFNHSNEDYSTSPDEERIYDVVAEELARNFRKEGLWLKALEKSGGDDNYAQALYMEKKEEHERQANEERQRIEIARKEEEEFKRVEEGAKIFAKEHGLIIKKQISEKKYLAAYNNSPVDAYIVLTDNDWMIVNV